MADLRLIAVEAFLSECGQRPYHPDELRNCARKNVPNWSPVMLEDDDRKLHDTFEWDDGELSDVDQALRELRSGYEGLSREERTKMRWKIERAIMLEERFFSLPRSLRIAFVTGRGRNVSTQAINPRLLARAIDAWANGKLFIPDGWFDLS